MDANIKINMDNAAFEDGHASELGRILRELAEKIEQEGPDHVRLRDVNGNHVGDFQISQ